MKSAVRREKGFSLIELLVVITIIAILVGWVVPNFSKFLLRIKLQNSSRQASTLLRLASRECLSQRRNVTVFIYTYDASGASAGGITNAMKSMIDRDITTSGTSWEVLTPGYVQMISPINIAATSAWSHGASSPDNELCQFAFSLFGTSSLRTMYITYNQPGDPNWETATPSSDYPDRLDYCTITTLDSQRVRLYQYLHKP